MPSYDDAIAAPFAPAGEPSVRQAGTAHGVLLLCVAIMPIMAMVTLIPVLPLLLQEFAAVPGAAYLVPIALTLPALCVALFSPLVGYLADRFGRRRMLIGALFVYVVLGMAPIILTNLWAIIASRAGLGITEAALMTLSTTMLGDYFKGPKLPKWVALQVAVGSMSAILLIGIGGALGQQIGSRGPFFLYLFALPIALFSIAMLFEPMAEKEEAAAAQVQFAIRPFLPILATTFAAGIFFYTLIVQLGPVLGLVGVTSPAMIGIVGSLANIGVASGSLLFKLLSRVRLPLVLAIAFGLVGIGYGGVSLSDNIAALAVFLVIASVGAGTLLPTLLSSVMKRLSIELRGRGTGLWTGTFFLAQFSAPILATLVAQTTGSLKTMLLIYAAFAAVAVVIGVIQGMGRQGRAAV